MSLLNNFKTKLNLSFGSINNSDIRLILKDLYEQVEKIQQEVDKINNEARSISKNRPTTNKNLRTDVSDTGI